MTAASLAELPLWQHTCLHVHLPLALPRLAASHALSPP
jgi:hypothetical protein